MVLTPTIDSNFIQMTSDYSHEFRNWYTNAFIFLEHLLYQLYYYYSPSCPFIHSGFISSIPFSYYFQSRAVQLLLSEARKKFHQSLGKVLYIILYYYKYFCLLFCTIRKINTIMFNIYKNLKYYLKFIYVIHLKK